MPEIQWGDLHLDGQAYQMRRLQGTALAASADWVPKTQSQLQSQPSLDPANQMTWHLGGGASRKVGNGQYAYALNGWALDPGVFLPGPLVTQVVLASQNGPVSAFAEHAGNLYVLAGRYVNGIANGSGAPALEKDLGVGATGADMLIFKTSLFVSNNVAMWERLANGTWVQTQSGTSPVIGTNMGRVTWTAGGVTAERLLLQTSSHTLNYVAADPRRSDDYSPGWGSGVDVGTYTLTGFTGMRDHIYLVSTAGILDLDNTGLAVPLTPEVQGMVMDNNGAAAAASSGHIYCGAGYGLVRAHVLSTYLRPVDYTMVEWCEPGRNLPFEGPGGGLPTALVRWQKWLVLAQWDSVSNTSYISFARDPGDNEPGPLVWHMYPIVIQGQKVTKLHVSGLIPQQPRLWMGLHDGVNASVAWAPLPMTTPLQDLLANRAYRFAQSATLVFSDEEWGDDSIQKDEEEVVIEADNLGSGNSVQVAVQADGNGIYNTLGTLTSSPRAVLRTATEQLCYRSRLMLTLAGLPAAPAIIRKISRRAVPNPDQSEVRTYEVLLGRGVGLSAGGREDMSPWQLKALLERLMHGHRVTMVDEYDQTLTVRVLDVKVSNVEEKSSEGSVYTAQLSIRVLGQQGATFKYDNGVKWDTPGRIWA